MLVRAGEGERWSQSVVVIQLFIFIFKIQNSNVDTVSKHFNSQPLKILYSALSTSVHYILHCLASLSNETLSWLTLGIIQPCSTYCHGQIHRAEQTEATYKTVRALKWQQEISNQALLTERWKLQRTHWVLLLESICLWIRDHRFKFSR